MKAQARAAKAPSRPVATPSSVALLPGAPRRSRSKSPRVCSVTLDVGGTLIACWPSVGHIYAEVAGRHGYRQLSPTVLNQRFKRAWQSYQDFRHTFADWSALVDATFQGLVDPAPSQSFFPELFERFSEPDAWRVFPDVLPALEALNSRGIKLGVISNWDSRLRPLLQRLDLERYFRTIVISCEHGACKPVCQLFAAACSSLGVPPENTLHVGDSLVMDVQGALDVGLQARHLRRRGTIRSRLEIKSLRELDKI